MRTKHYFCSRYNIRMWVSRGGSQHLDGKVVGATRTIPRAPEQWLRWLRCSAELYLPWCIIEVLRRHPIQATRVEFKATTTPNTAYTWGCIPNYVSWIHQTKWERAIKAIISHLRRFGTFRTQARSADTLRQE